MGWQDFRTLIDEFEWRGEIKVVEEADCDLEIGTLTELMAERHGPMLLFDRINGDPQGYRIAAKPYSTPARGAIALWVHPPGGIGGDGEWQWSAVLQGLRSCMHCEKNGERTALQNVTHRRTRAC